MEEYADLVKIHYQYHKNPRNYKKYIPAGYVELDGYTDSDSIAFKKGEEIVIAMRGLNPTQLRDLRIGAEIIAGDVMNPRGFDFDTSRGKYKQILDNEQEKYEKIKQQFPDAKIVFAGHSRGGRKAIDLGKHNNVEYKAYNPGDATSLRDYMYSVGIPIAMAQMPLPFLEGSEYMAAGLVAGVRAGSSDNPYATTAGSLFQSTLPNVIERAQLGMEGVNPFTNLEQQRFDVDVKKEAAKKTQGLIAHLVNIGQIPPEAYEDALRMQQDAIGDTRYFGTDIAKAAGMGVRTSYLPLLASQKENNENIFVTERDIVSHGYKGGKMSEYFGGRPTIVEAKEYIKSLDITHHSIDHFTSKELLDAIANDEKIRVLDDALAIPSRFEREAADAPRGIRSSGAQKTRPINVSQLCDAYPQLIECQYMRENQKL